MSDIPQHAQVLIIGAGMAGLSAAKDLQAAGKQVLVIDKSRGLGGRMANRRMGDGAIAEHGAQFVTARSDRFKSLMSEWEAAGVVKEWFRSGGEHGDAYPHYRGNPTMSAMAKQLAQGIDTALGKRAASVALEDGQWLTTLESGETITSDEILITSPVPQTLALLEAGNVALSDTHKAQLEGIEYDPCITVMAVLHHEPEVPEPGGLAMSVGPFSWLADNVQKGITEVPTITLQANADYSRENWDRDRNEVGQELLTMAEHLLGASVKSFQVHAWLYSKPVAVEDSPCLVVSDSPKMVLAGDAFDGPKVEGAVLSGWAAAQELLS
ncbi:FAD-dependent oxidoreductase [Leucothrix sargassi]|nr:FAD-dependent oxidoreductase [Leucothrix sargassi]